MALSFKPTVKNWRLFVVGEIEIFDSFVEKLEKKIAEELDTFEDDIEELEFEYPDGSDFGQIVRVKDGLDDISWSLEAVFLDYFPNLQRKAHVISLFSFFESSLKELCLRYQTEIQAKVTFTDLAGRGVSKYRAYLDKVVGLEFDKVNQRWDQITNIKKVRNKIVHNEGKVSDEEKALRQFIESNKYLELRNNNEVNILPGFLTHMLRVMEEFVYDVDKLVEERETKSQI